jgi:hypothetical protein
MLAAQFHIPYTAAREFRSHTVSIDAQRCDISEGVDIALIKEKFDACGAFRSPQASSSLLKAFVVPPSGGGSIEFSLCLQPR